MNKAEIKIPAHVGVIMDGNRRWAKERNLPAIEGHLKGFEKMKASARWFLKKGVETLTVYAFSTENWNRSRDEVNYLMKLFKKAINDEIETADEKDYRVYITGRTEELPGDLPELCQKLMDKTAGKKAAALNICLNYGGRAEIVDAVKKMIQNKITSEQVHEGMIKKYLYQEHLSDPDIIVRTSGEKRLSGFQLWQSAYSELMFMEKYWPDFEENDVDKVIEEYSRRKRRFGGDNGK